jgi:hypothetical protein
MPPGSSPGGSGPNGLVPRGLPVQVFSLPVGSFRQDATVVGRNRGQVLVENLKRVDGARERPVYPRARQFLGAPPGWPPVGRLRRSA